MLLRGTNYRQWIKPVYFANDFIVISLCFLAAYVYRFGNPLQMAAEYMLYLSLSNISWFLAAQFNNAYETDHILDFKKAVLKQFKACYLWSRVRNGYFSFAG